MNKPNRGPVRIAIRFVLLLFWFATMIGARPSVAHELHAPQQFGNLGDLRLQNGQIIHGCKLGYRTLGKLNGTKSNAVLYPTWFTGSSGDLLPTLGPTHFFDPSPYFVILVDALGDGISCSPSNSATQHGIAFPHFGIRDMVDAEHQLVTQNLGLHHVRAVMGMSMGGMQTLSWIVRYPTFMDAAISIVGSPRLTSYDMLLWRTEEAAMLSDPAYAGGRYAKAPALPAVQLIHNLNLTTPDYRVEHTDPRSFDRFFRATSATTNGAFDANDWRWQIHAMLGQDIAAGRSMRSAARLVRARVLVINARQDHMVNPIPALGFAPLIGARTIVLTGNCGHIAPICEAATMRPGIEATLRGPTK